MSAGKGTPPKDRRERKSHQEARAELAKKFGRDVLVQGKELKGRVVLRQSTGSLALDMMLGGGWPLNQPNEIIGMPSSGKTSMVLKTIAIAQAANPKHRTLWVASEPFVEQWAEAAGIDMDRMEIAETNIMEEAYEVVIAYLDNRLVDAIVIDSFPALIPADEEDSAMTEWQMGLGARLTGKFFRKQSTAGKRSLTEEDRPCLLLIINQWRMKIGLTFGDPRTTPGGGAKDYFYFTRVEVKRDEWIETDKFKVGISMKAHTVKNKTAPPERVAAVDFYFDSRSGMPAGCYDEAKDLLACGLFTEVVEKAGSMYSFSGQTWRGQDAVKASLREDIELSALLRYEVLRAVGINEEPPKVARGPRRPSPGTTAGPRKAVAPSTKAAAPKMVRRGRAS
jgi:recombination protein RecA